jgi:hypothetical protein
MSFQAPFDPMDFMRMRMTAEQQRMGNEQAKYVGISNAIDSLLGAYSTSRDEAAEIGAMDKGVGMMSDIGAVNPDVRDKFMNLDKREKPFVFDLLRQGMFAPYAAGQSAVQQARGWADNRGGGGGGGGMPSGARNQYGYFYQGP